MDQFYQYERQIQQGQVLWTQYSPSICCQIPDMAADRPQSKGNQSDPQNCTVHREGFSYETHPPVEKAVGIPQWYADKKEIADCTSYFSPDVFLMTLKKRFCIGCQITLEQIRTVQLAQKLYHLALGRCSISDGFASEFGEASSKYEMMRLISDALRARCPESSRDTPEGSIPSASARPRWLFPGRLSASLIHSVSMSRILGVP